MNRTKRNCKVCKQQCYARQMCRICEKMKMKSCIECKKAFKPKSTQKYCTKQCWAINRAKKLKKIELKERYWKIKVNKMDVLEDSKAAMKELRAKGIITIIEDPTDEKKFDQMVNKAKTWDEMIKMMKEEGWSEFTIGAIIGLKLAAEGKMKQKQGFRRYMPQMFRN